MLIPDFTLKIYVNPGLTWEVATQGPSLDNISTNKHEGGAAIRAGAPIRRYTVDRGVV